jgi:hypothetical protein
MFGTRVTISDGAPAMLEIAPMTPSLRPAPRFADNPDVLPGGIALEGVSLVIPGGG